ncbi:MAG TPA: PAS domain-containing protein [Hanamia sp.]|nr:PAS domain-containing protein [Hanamia sp.]
MSRQIHKHPEQNENLADSIISLLYEPFLVLDKKFVIQKANQSFYQLINVEEQEVIGKSFFEINDSVFNTESLQNAFANTVQEVKKSETHIVINERTISLHIQFLKSENDELILVALKETNFEKNPQLLAQNEVEKNLRLILESIPQITITLSAEGYVTFFNHFFLDYTGLPFEEAISAKGWKQILHPEEIEEIIKAAQYSLMTAKIFTKKSG